MGGTFGLPLALVARIFFLSMVFFLPLLGWGSQQRPPGRVVSSFILSDHNLFCPPISTPLYEALRHDPLRPYPKTNYRILLIRCSFSLSLSLSLHLFLFLPYPSDSLIGFRPLTSFENRAQGDPETRRPLERQIFGHC